MGADGLPRRRTRVGYCQSAAAIWMRPFVRSETSSDGDCPFIGVSLTRVTVKLVTEA